MQINREAIIAALHAGMAARAEVLACWLEGADAAGQVDGYSDIDFCVSLAPGGFGAAEDAARAALQALGPLDLDERTVDEPNQRDATFHFAGTSPHLLVDLCLYDGCGSDFIAGDSIEKPLVLFDRAGVVRFHPAQERLAAADLPARRKRIMMFLDQSSRVGKWIARGAFLEAFGYYRRYLLEPLIEALRLRYTPLHPEYGIVHISRHLPPEVIARLERLHQVTNLPDLATRAALARAWLAEEMKDEHA
ncbi:MAG: hypothetical protein ACYC6L_01440 [Anaerolineae bacterium]